MTFQVTNLSCERQQKILFADISFQLNNGNIMLVEGPNGSGKSSLLKLLSGLVTPDSGDIIWRDQSITHAHSEFFQQLHYIGHVNGIKLGLTVLENLQLMQTLFSDVASVEFDAVLSLLKLQSEKNTLAKYLSAGQKRRLALAKLFLFSRTLWIFDEPFTALDSDTQQLLTHKIEEHVLRGGIAIVSSHHAINFTTVQAQTLSLPLC